MAQIDSNATKEQLAQMEREFAIKRAEAERKRAYELARMSEQRRCTDAQGSTWEYVVVDGQFVRILSCASALERIEIPGEIAGLPVREMGPEALSNLPDVEEIICADSIESIGPYAFRGCAKLVRLVLPDQTSNVLSSWTSGCEQLEELWLPGSYEAIGPEALSNPAVRVIVIRPRTRFVDSAAFENANLNEVRISEDNPYLMTDGTCIYSGDGTVLFTLVCAVQSCVVQPGCEYIGKKAFSGARSLEHVVLPESVKSIGPLAFARSGLVALTCPQSLVEIDEKAFMRCRALKEIELNEGLITIADEAFAGSGLERLRIPASVAHVGRSVAERSNVCFSGPEATFEIDERNEFYDSSEDGCLYRQEADGLHLVYLLEPQANSCVVKPGTVAIDEKAFAFRHFLEVVDLPLGLRRIGPGAFKVCRKLRQVNVPDTLEAIGAEAFIDTALDRFDIPAGLVEIGTRALVTDGAHHEGPPPSLREIDIDPCNGAFFMHDGMLCRRRANGVSLVVFTSSCARVSFPPDVVEIEDYAFNNAFGIEELHLNARLRTIGACGLSVMSQIRRVKIDVAEPIEGRSSFDLHFPATTHSVHGFLLALGGLGHLHLPEIMAQYDSCIASSRNYHAPRSSDNASAYEQVLLIVARLQDSVLLTDVNRKRYCDLLAENIEEICMDVARHDDRETLGQLMDLGFLNADNLAGVIAAVNRLQDASITGYLLEAKRTRFNQRAIDFDL